ncbi:hypothetical protein Pfo_030040 [Paulownia fortunei]|nr:hypothetical protein Pfo_030040 [Paulownia fortunei]
MTSEYKAELESRRSAIKVRVRFKERVSRAPILPEGTGTSPTSLPLYLRKAVLLVYLKPTLLGLLTEMPTPRVTFKRTLSLAMSTEKSRSSRETELTVVTGRLALKTVSPRIRNNKPRPRITAVTHRHMHLLLVFVLRCLGEPISLSSCFVDLDDDSSCTSILYMLSIQNSKEVNRALGVGVGSGDDLKGVEITTTTERWWAAKCKLKTS